MSKEKIRILFVCHGNICRSPMAEYYMKNLVEENNISDRFEIDSAATSTEEIGNGVHYGTRNVLGRHNIPCGNHKARQMTKADYDYFDLLIGMDSNNIRNINRIIGSDSKNKVHKMMEYTDSKVHDNTIFSMTIKDVADPWYTGDFEATYQDISTGCQGLLELLKKHL